MLNVVMLNVVMLNVVMLNIVSPSHILNRDGLLLASCLRYKCFYERNLFRNEVNWSVFYC
jgi:hypothetical protein